MLPLLSVQNLKVNYESVQGLIYAVRGVSFNIQKSECFGIIGESGSGKSTICKALMGMIRENIKGSILFKGHNLLKLSQKEFEKLYSKDISILPQASNALNPLMSIKDHIHETIKVNDPGMAKISLKKRALNLLNKFHNKDIERVYRAFPYQLSGGMSQRSVMAIAFSCNPCLVIADEPTKGLDNRVKNEILDVIKQIQKSDGLALLIVTHDLDVLKVCDRVAVIYDGKFVETGSVNDVISDPIHPYTKALINAMPANGMIPTWGFAPSSLKKDDVCSFQKRCPFGKKLNHKHIIKAPVLLSNDRLVWCCNVKSKKC